MRIPPPPRSGTYPDRLLDCEMALETAVQDMIEDAEAAGWRPAEITMAIERWPVPTG